MTKSKRSQIIKWANTLTDDELEKEYYQASWDTLGSQAEAMYEQGWEGKICYVDDIDKLLKEMVGEEK